jgi:outer membrane protein
MMLNIRFFKYPVILFALIFSSAALATQEGDILVRLRLVNVSPDASSSLAGLDVEDHYTLDIDFTYMVSNNFGVELLLDTSSSHRITLNGSDIAVARVLPPSLIAQYHFSPNSNLRPYVGAGVNYTLFFDEEAVGLLSGGTVELDESIGLVAQAGFDYDINSEWFINFDIKYIDMDADATINNTILGATATLNVDINPTLIGIGIGTRF